MIYTHTCQQTNALTSGIITKTCSIEYILGIHTLLLQNVTTSYLTQQKEHITSSWPLDQYLSRAQNNRICSMGNAQCNPVFRGMAMRCPRLEMQDAVTNRCVAQDAVRRVQHLIRAY